MAAIMRDEITTEVGEHPNTDACVYRLQSCLFSQRTFPSFIIGFKRIGNTGKQVLKAVGFCISVASVILGTFISLFVWCFSGNISQWYIMNAMRQRKDRSCDALLCTILVCGGVGLYFAPGLRSVGMVGKFTVDERIRTTVGSIVRPRFH